ARIKRAVHGRMRPDRPDEDDYDYNERHKARARERESAGDAAQPGTHSGLRAATPLRREPIEIEVDMDEATFRAVLREILADELGCGAAQPRRGPFAPIGQSHGEVPPRSVQMALDGLDGAPVEVAGFRGRAVLVVAFMMDDLNSQALLRDVERVARAHPEDL